MIKRLKLVNFRSHKNTELNFHPGINVICGLSRSGKSNLFRALQWVLSYRPTGDRIIRRGVNINKEQVQVFLDTDNAKVALVKAGSQTVYQLNEGDTFRGFGQTVPKEITEALNIGEVNLQNQLNEYYLITESPGEVARVINDIIRIEKVDQYVSSISSKIYSTQRTMAILEDQNKETKENIDKLSYLDDFKIQVDKIFTLDREYKTIEETMKGISDLEFAYKESVQEIKELDVVIKDVLIDIKALETDVNQLGVITNSIVLFEEVLSYDKLIDAKAVKQFIKNIEDCFQLLNKNGDIEYTINHLLVDAEDWYENDNKMIAIEKQEGRFKRFLEELIEEYTEVLEKNKQCPVCYSPIDDECLKMVVENLKERYEG